MSASRPRSPARVPRAPAGAADAADLPADPEQLSTLPGHGSPHAPHLPLSPSSQEEGERDGAASSPSPPRRGGEGRGEVGASGPHDPQPGGRAATGCGPVRSELALAALRRRIAALERRPAALEGAAVAGPAVRLWRLGVDALDGALPEGGLASDGLHEAAGESAADGPAAAAFLAALLVRLAGCSKRGPVLVCQSRGGAARFGRLHGPGWRDLGLEPADLLILRARREKDVPWAMEEGLRCGALAAVLAEVEGLAFGASRRLALAAAEGATPALLLRHDGLGPASAALTRWRVAALPGGADPFDEAAPGSPRWRLALVRARGGRPTTCDVEWNRETGDFRMAAALADRPATPRAAAPAVEAPHRPPARAG